MKRKLLIVQYESVRSSIAANVDIISKLIDQADKLTDLANMIKEKDPNNQTLIADIESQITNLKNLIIELLEQTNKLFDNYSAFADEVFDN